MRTIFTVALAAVLCPTLLAGQTIYGVKSAAVGPSSGAPSRLFSFDGSTGAVNDIAWVTYGGQQVDADAIASDGSNLYGFLQEQGGSRLVTIDVSTGAASSLAFYQGMAMRGATYRNGKLYTLDVTQGVTYNVATIDLSTYASTSVGLNTAIADGCDLDFDSQGVLWVAEAAGFHTLNPNTGVLWLVAGDLVPQPGNISIYNVGFVFDETYAGRSVTLEANGTDDLYVYGMPSPARTTLTPNILGYFNSGRGDLAAVPEPATLAALGLGLATLCRKRRR